MRDLYEDSDFVYETSGREAQPNQPIDIPPSSIFVTTVNGLTGAITFSGGTSGFTFSPSGAVITLTSPLTTKGDLYTRDGSNGVRLAVGANDARLVADSTQTTGLRWQAVSTGWTASTGTATRSGFDTTTATATDVAQALKALLDDLLTQKILKP